MSMSEAGALLSAVDVSSRDQKAGNRDGDHRDAESNQRQSGYVAESVLGRRQRAADQGRGATSRNRSNFSTMKPKAITAMAVRTQARKVRSFAEWSAKFLIMVRKTAAELSPSAVGGQASSVPLNPACSGSNALLVAVEGDAARRGALDLD
jgi:hypothetical protein